MNKFVKLAALAATVLATTPALAAPVGVTGAPPSATARIIKPLTLTSTGSLNFGTVVMVNVTSDQTISLSSANALTCGDNVQVTCSGTTSVPTYNVRGTQGQVVTIIKTASDLTNANDGTTLSMTPLGAADLTLGNSGAPGAFFEIGGSIVIGSATTDGVYSGTVNVQVDYQ
ncbi:MAG: DUF4402 domain-containing protein [Pseudomonadota bacterium]